jgi:NDP-sugar pyrophosphorylase family protein
MTKQIDMTAITALILVGGLGSRLRSVVKDIPKSLAQVNEYPFIHYLLQNLHNQKILDVILCTGYGTQQIETYCQNGSNWEVQIRYSKEAIPLGTAGAIKQAQGLINSRSFLVLNGDSFVNAHMASMVQFHIAKNAKATIALVDVPDSSRFGSVSIDDEGAITAFQEKGNLGPGLINAGIYVLDQTVLDIIPPAQNISFEQEVFAKLIGKGLCGVVVDKPFVDIGTPFAYRLAPSILANWPA